MKIKKISHGELPHALHEAVNAGRLAWVSMSTSEKNSAVLTSATNKKLWLDVSDFVVKIGNKYEVEPVAAFKGHLADAKVIVGTADNIFSVLTEALPGSTPLSIFVEMTQPRHEERAVYLTKRLEKHFNDVDLNLITDMGKGGVHETD